MPPTGDPDFGCPGTANINCALTASLTTSLTADLDEKEDLAKAACQFISFPVTAGTETSPTIHAPNGTNFMGKQNGSLVVTLWERYLLGRERLCDAGNKFIFIF